MERLDKFLAHMGYGTRKEVKKIIKDGLVKINNEIVYDSDFKVKEDDLIEVDNNIVEYKTSFYYLLNKPSNYISSTIDEAYPSVLNLVPNKANLFPVGRLDIDTEGFLLITNDGVLAHRLLSPKLGIEKEYYFKYEGVLAKDSIKRCLDGIKIDDYITKPAKLNIINNSEGTIIVTEGKFHEVKKIILSLGGKVTYLKRIKFAGMDLGNLEIGDYRELSEEEIMKLKKI